MSKKNQNAASVLTCRYTSLGFISMLFFAVSCYKLLNSSLWLDEAVEFFYSKSLFGSIDIPGAGNTELCTNMYQRIITTLQPPLYNIIMYFWLKISTTEFWFRFAGVVMSYFGLIGIFYTLEYKTNLFAATVSCIIYTFSYRIVYYTQECSEYSLLLGLIPWAIYFFVLSIDRLNLKDIMCCILFSILSIYTQYGAAFVIIPLLTILLIKICFSKNREILIKTIFLYILSLILFAIPLYAFFLKKQIGMTTSEKMAFVIDKNIFNDFFVSIRKMFLYVFMGDPNAKMLIIAASVIIVCAVLATIFVVLGEKKDRYIIFSLWITVLLNYLAIKVGVYGTSYIENGFASRYCIFEAEIFLILFSLLFYKLINLANSKIETAIPFMNGVAMAFTIAFIACNSLILQYNWSKANTRECVKEWYNRNGYQYDTFVYCGFNHSFMYYLNYSGDYMVSNTDSNIILQQWMSAYPKEEIFSYLDTLYTTLPDNIYLCIPAAGTDSDNILEYFSSLYDMEVCYEAWDIKLINAIHK